MDQEKYAEPPVLVGWVACIKCDTWFNPKKYETCPTCGSSKDMWKK